MAWGSERTSTTKPAQGNARGALRLLVIADGELASHALPETGEVTIGRSRATTIQIQHESISRVHAAITIGDGLAIVDRASRNGVFVRGERIASERATPITPAELVELGAVAITVQRVHATAAAQPPDDQDGALVVRDPAMRELHAHLARLAPTDITVLVLGETGVGKEIIAAELHRMSPRAPRPYLRINCAALSEQLLESELFGHEKGAFTGAMTAKPGLFESAGGGTILLDEIGEISIAMQAKLLRAIEERKVMRVGALAPRSFEARFVAATNRDLAAEIVRGKFRQDLYFRLAGVTVTVPPLRDRLGEIEPLARRFAADVWSRSGRPGTPELSTQAVDLLRRHRWPGNIRELRNVIERAVVLSEQTVIGPHQLQLDDERAANNASLPLRDEARALERRRIVEALERCGGNQSEVARLLGIPRRTLLTRLDEYGLPRPRKK